MSDSSLLIYGSTGFVGHSLLLQLENEGWRNVFAINRKQSHLHGPNTREFALDEFRLRKHLQTYPKTTIVNMTNAYSKSTTLSREQLAANLFHPLTIASALEDERQTFLQVGTYFEELRLAEAPYSYAWAKKTTSRMLSESSHKKGFAATLVKLFDVYGESDKRPKLMNLLTQHFSDPEPAPLVISNPNRKFFPIHISDTVKYILDAINEPGSQTLASPSKATTIGELVDMFREQTGRGGNISWLSEDLEVHDDFFYRRFPESRAEISILDGIQRLLRHQ